MPERTASDYHAVTPYLVVTSADPVIEFLAKAFGSSAPSPVARASWSRRR